MLVEAESRRRCSALCALARICLSVCCSQFFFLRVTCTDDPHGLKCAIKSQVIPQLVSLSIHAVASLNKSLTYQCLRNLERIVIESHRKHICALVVKAAEEISFMPSAISVPLKLMFRCDNRSSEKALSFWQFASVVIEEGIESHRKRKVAHGSGAVIQWRRTWQNS